MNKLIWVHGCWSLALALAPLRAQDRLLSEPPAGHWQFGLIRQTPDLLGNYTKTNVASMEVFRVVAGRNGVTVSDEIEFEYQTAKWGKPARFALAQIARDRDVVTIEATAFDAKGVLSLDARNVVRFSLAGSGSLIDNQGTSTGSRVVQLYNGRARISVRCNDGACTAGVTSEGIAPAFVTVSA